MVAKPLTVAVAICLIVGVSVASAQNFGRPIGTDFRLEWMVQGVSGPWQGVCGYIYNDRPVTARNVRVQIEGVDEGGRIASTRYGSIVGDVQALGRSYFCFPVAGDAPTYRIAVFSADWDSGGQ